MNKTVIMVAVLLSIFLVPVRTQAKDDNKVKYPENPGKTEVPFNGISLLLASAAAYAGKLSFNNKKEKINNPKPENLW